MFLFIKPTRVIVHRNERYLKWKKKEYTYWCSEIGSLTSLDACNSGASSDAREPINFTAPGCIIVFRWNRGLMLQQFDHQTRKKLNCSWHATKYIRWKKKKKGTQLAWVQQFVKWKMLSSEMLTEEHCFANIFHGLSCCLDSLRLNVTNEPSTF